MTLAIEMIPLHQKMPPANSPDLERRLGDEKPVVTIQTKTNNKLKLNPAVPIRIRSPHAVPCAAPASITNFAVLPIAA